MLKRFAMDSWWPIELHNITLLTHLGIGGPFMIKMISIFAYEDTTGCHDSNLHMEQPPQRISVFWNKVCRVYIETADAAST